MFWLALHPNQNVILPNAQGYSSTPQTIQRL
ncbi:MAG: hypothetical protein ACI9Y1_000525, partial [Lentisphaeria bacterium]